MMTTTTMTKRANNHDKKDPLEGGKYARRAKARRRDWHLPRRYIVWPSRFTTVAGFLLMAEATVATAIASLSTVALGASLLLGAGSMTIILGLLTLHQLPGQQ
jgi:hypothetical protein